MKKSIRITESPSFFAPFPFTSKRHFGFQANYAKMHPPDSVENKMALVILIDADSYEKDDMLIFEHEVYYWVMYPEIEAMMKTCGRYIDLYDSMLMQVPEFVHLKKLIADVRRRISNKPATWEQFIGRQLKPVEKDLYQPVSKNAFSSFLDRFDALIDKAEQQGSALLFDGD